ncbi:MAG TPA: hypothetical protein VK816_00675 [Jatrophihabitantaceae bacterium]|jgi:hypothetical protein|nr:hypothetical protein [Jatrophihabitantaceae bacterium]
MYALTQHDVELAVWNFRQARRSTESCYAAWIQTADGYAAMCANAVYLQTGTEHRHAAMYRYAHDRARDTLTASYRSTISSRM